jgi:S-adenosylmethionine hydrolase
VRKYSSLVLFLLLSSPSSARPLVALLTDFGLDNEAVGMCHGAILAVNPEINVVDLCHRVEPYNIQQGSLMLKRTVGFPKGSVIVAVVDPGVGTERTALAIETNRHLFYVAPNNGLLSEVIRDQGILKAYRLDPKRVDPDWSPGPFDGRDLFAPAGALLASSSGSLERIGVPARDRDIILLDPIRPALFPDEHKVVGHYLRTDTPYGNVWTDIRGEDLSSIGASAGTTLRVVAGKQKAEVPLVVSFGQVGKGKPLAYLDSGGSLALAINQGNISREWDLLVGMEITIIAVKKGG